MLNDNRVPKLDESDSRGGTGSAMFNIAKWDDYFVRTFDKNDIHCFVTAQ